MLFPTFFFCVSLMLWVCSQEPHRYICMRGWGYTAGAQ